MTDAGRLEAERRAELERRLYLIARFVPAKWISLRYSNIASMLVEQPTIMVAQPQTIGPAEQ